MSGPRPAHLQRRGAIYAARFRLPVDLAQALGVAEIRRSLHTADPKRGRERCLQANLWFQGAVAELRAMTSPTKADLEAAARAFFEEGLSAFGAPKPFASDHEHGFNVEETLKRLRSLEDQLRTAAFDAKVQYAAHVIGLRAGCDGEDVVEIETQQLAARVEREQMRFLLHRFTEPWSELVIEDPLLSGSTGSDRSDRSAGDEVHEYTLAQGVARYLDRKRVAGVGSSQFDEIGRALSWLRNHLGDSTPLRAIRREHLREFRDGLERIDARLKGRGGYTFGDRQTGNAEHWISSVTATRHWRAVQAFFAWAVVEESAISSDPSAGLRIARRKADVSRTPEPFTSEELRRLFESPLYAGHKSPKQLLAPGTCRERGAFWWSGLLALYTGLRAGEIAQVLTSDFDFEKPVPVIHVRPEDQAGHRAKRVKTAASVREVPIAPTLIALGLREFVESRRERSGARRLLREINLGQKDRTSDGMSKFWGRALRAAKVHKPGRSVHVFRHTVTAAMRSAGVSNDVIGAFLGHQPTTVTGQYGGRYPPNLLAEAASAIDFGFDVIEALGGIYVHKLHGSGPATAKY